MAYSDSIRNRFATREGIADLIDGIETRDWTDYTPTYSGANGLVITGTPTTNECKYKYLDGEVVMFYGEIDATIGTAGGSFGVSLPVNEAYTVSVPYAGPGFRYTGGSTTRRQLIGFFSSNVLFLETYDGTNWPTGATSIGWQIVYRVG